MVFLKRNIYTVVFVALSIGIFILYAENKNSTFLFSALGILSTAYFGLIKQKSENDQLFKSLFDHFNDKYDKDFNDLLNSLQKNNAMVLNEKDCNILIDYFNLCAEEYLWYKKGRIPKDVWSAWRKGIIANLKIKQVDDIYKREMGSLDTSDSYYGLKDDLIRNF